VTIRCPAIMQSLESRQWIPLASLEIVPYNISREAQTGSAGFQRRRNDA